MGASRVPMVVQEPDGAVSQLNNEDIARLGGGECPSLEVSKVEIKVR